MGERPPAIEAVAASAADETPVRARFDQFMQAWNWSGSQALATVCGQDGDLVGFTGTHCTGRGGIAPVLQELCDRRLEVRRLVGQERYRLGSI